MVALRSSMPLPSLIRPHVQCSVNVVLSEMGLTPGGRVDKLHTGDDAKIGFNYVML